MRLVGWIRARKSDRARLRDTFNVKGKMIYNRTMKCFEYCTLDNMEVVEKLRCDWPDFFAGAFTAIDDEGNQLAQQPCWGMKSMRKERTKKCFGWIRGFYNNLGLRFDLDGKINWLQLWPPRIWMLRNFLSNSGLIRRSQMFYRLHKYLHHRILEELRRKNCHS